jgi:hypothetical protein
MFNIFEHNTQRLQQQQQQQHPSSQRNNSSEKSRICFLFVCPTHFIFVVVVVVGMTSYQI